MYQSFCQQMQFLTRSLGVGAIAGILLSVLPSYAEFKPPGDLEKPGNRRGLATRVYQPPRRGPLNETTPRQPDGAAPAPPPSPDVPPVQDTERDIFRDAPSREKTCVADGKPTLTTLVPSSNIGLTASAFPTFYWFMPANSYRVVQFSLFKVDEVGNALEEVYSSRFQASGKAGVSSVSIPTQETTLTLEPGVDYRWQVGLYCSKRQKNGLVANGWIRFVPPPPKLAEQFATTPDIDKVDVYAEAGYWYDALRVLAIARQTQPSDARFTKAWKDLFESETVQLPDIAAQNQ